MTNLKIHNNKRMPPALLKFLIIALSILFTLNATATVQKFTVDGITYEYAFDNNGDNESLSVVEWDASIIDLIIPEGIDIPDNIETPETSDIKAKVRKFKTITLFKPVFVAVIPSTESITFQGASIRIAYAFSSLPYLRNVRLSPNTEFIPSNFLKGCKNIKSYEIGPKVKEIGSYAFAGTGLDKIRIPSSVEKMDSYCFSECENLTEVVIESNEEQNCYRDFIINNHQFQNCKSLESITIGAGVSRINPQEAFNGCNMVKEFVISSGLDDLYFEGYYNGHCIFEQSPLKKIMINRNYDSDFKAPYDPYKPSPFSSHPTLEEVEIGGKVTRLNMEAFKSCPNLSKVKFHVQLKTIDSGSFKDLPSLRKINLPEGIEKISGHLFEDCENLVDIEIPTTVKEIAEYAFNNCKSLPNLTLHEGIESLSNCSFSGCTSFTEFSFPNSLKEPGSLTFSNCTNLNKVIIGTGLNYLDPEIFKGCPVLYDFTFLDGDEYWDSRYGVGNLGIFCAYPIKNLYLGRNHNYVTQYYSKQPFSGSETLTNVTFGNKITEIQPWAFHLCKSISQITFSDNLEKIGAGAFYGNKSLKILDFPASLKEIDERAFCDCDSLTDIILPEHFERADGVLASGIWSWNTGIINITSLNHTPPSISDEAFGWKAYDNAIVYVPEQSVELYKTTFPWSKFKNIRAIGSSGIENISTDNSFETIDYKTPYKVYTLNGVKVAESVDNLASGLYIIRQGGKVKKIAIN